MDRKACPGCISLHKVERRKLTDCFFQPAHPVISIGADEKVTKLMTELVKGLAFMDPVSLETDLSR